MVCAGHNRAFGLIRETSDQLSDRHMRSCLVEHQFMRLDYCTKARDAGHKESY